MKTILLIIGLFFTVSSFSQSIGLKAGTNIYKPFDSKYHASPLIGLTFKYSPKRIGFGIEPSLSSIYGPKPILTDNSGNIIKSNNKTKSIALEVPVYIFYKVIDKDFLFNIEAGASFYGKSTSLFYGLYGGYKINDFSIGVNYRLNGIVSNPFSTCYHSTFISIQYSF